MTVQEYLAQKRLNDPYYRNHSDVSLYKALKGRDPNLPEWKTVDNMFSGGTKSKKPYQKDPNLGFVQSLALGDWGLVDENSANWVKAAYNNSITGMAYQMTTGRAQFEYDENWNPGILEDIGSAVLSFTMPLDFASMFVGGWIGKAGLAAGAASKSVQSSAVKKLVSSGIKKNKAKEIVSNVINGKSGTGILFPTTQAKAQLTQQAFPRLSGAVGQAATLATFEGVHGGLAAAVNGEDVWEGIRDGVMHGGFMGAAAGFVGASLNVKHAALLSKAEKKTKVETVSQGISERVAQAFNKENLALRATGAVGQVGAEAGVFTLPDVYKVITDDNFTLKDLGRNAAVNVGMMGILKAKSKLLKEGAQLSKDFIAEHMPYTKFQKQTTKMFDDITNRVKSDNSADKNNSIASDKIIKTAEGYLNPILKKFEVDGKKLELKDLVEIEKVIDNLIEKVNKFEKGELPAEKIHADDYFAMIEAIHSVKGLLESNIGRHTKDVPLKKQQIKRLENIVERFETEILEPLRNNSNYKKDYIPTSIEKATIESKLNTFINESIIEGDLNKINLLTKGNENAINVKFKGKGKNKRVESIDIDPNAVRWDTLRDRVQAHIPVVKIKSKKGKETGIAETDSAGEKSVAIKTEKGVLRHKIEEGDPTDTRTTYKERIKTLEDKLNDRELTVTERDVLKREKELLEIAEKENTQSDMNKHGANDIGTAYQKNKPFFYWLAEYIDKTYKGKRGKFDLKGGKKRLNDTIKFAKWLAKNRKKSLFELTKEDLKVYFESGVGKKSHGEMLSMIIKEMKERQFYAVKSLADVVPSGKSSILDIMEISVERAKGKPGFRTLVQKGMEEIWKVGKGFVEFIQPKKAQQEGGKIKKYVTEEVSDKLEKMQKDTTGAQEGHEGLLFRDSSGKGIIGETVTKLMKKIFPLKKVPKGEAGEARLMRNSLEQHFVKKYGVESAEAKIALELILGDKPSNKIDLVEVYGTKTYNKAERMAKEFVKEYLKDIDKGSFKDVNGKIVKIDKSMAKEEAGYNAWEIKKGLEKLKTLGDKDGNIKVNGVKINKEVVETMIKYMIQTAPRINEIVPRGNEIKDIIANQKKYNELVAKGEADPQFQTAERTAQAIISAIGVKRMVDWVKRTPGLKNLRVKIEKDLGKHEGRYVLGQITGHLIEIAEGRARIDTIPHEVSHYVVDALKAMGDARSKKLIKDGTRIVKEIARQKGEKIDNKEAEHRIVQLLGEYAGRRVMGEKPPKVNLTNKTIIGKMKTWVTDVMNYWKTKLGIINMNDAIKIRGDIVSVLGEKVFKGEVPTDYMPLRHALKTQYQTGNTSKGYEKLKKTHDATRSIINRLKAEGISEKSILETIEDSLGIKGYWNIKKGDSNTVNVGQLLNLQTRLNTLSNKNITKEKSKKYIANEEKVEQLEIEKNISVETREHIFETVYGVKFEDASLSQIRSYRAYLKPLESIYNQNAIDGDVYNSYDKKTGQSTSISLLGRPFMTVGDALVKYGYKKLAQAMDLHDYYRTTLYGDNTVVTDRITKIVNDRKVRNNYMHLIDKKLSESAISQLTELSKDKNYTKAQRDMFKKELKKVKEVSKKFQKGGDWVEARDLWNETTNKHWETIKLEINRNTNPREAQKIIEGLNELYIKDYFTRRVRNEVLDNLNATTPAVTKLARNIRKQLTKEELKKISNKLIEDGRLTRGSREHKEILGKKGELLQDYIANEIFDMFQYGPAKVNPFFMKKRGAQLPEYIEIIKDGKKKLVRTYDGSMDGTMIHYGLGMTKLIATTRYFPEWTNFGGKFSTDKGTKAAIIKGMEAQGNEAGIYALLALKRQLGLSQTAADRLNAPYSRFAGKVTNLSAVVGLSSPTSGLKNMLIQLPRSAYLYGTRNTIMGYSNAFKIYYDKEGYKKAQKEGLIGYGTKTTLLESPEVGKYIRFWFDKVNLMTTSENINRIALAEAGRMHFNDLVSQFRGQTTLFSTQIWMSKEQKAKEMSRYFKEVWRLTDKQIDWLKKTENVSETKEYGKMLNWVGHQSHKRGAGATGTADLPLWMSNRYGKPLTLFQRIATSVTIDTYKNVVKPIKNGNLAPLFKATLGHGLAGASLYYMYKYAFNQQAPKEDSPFLDRAIANIWRGEMLGVFGNIAQPFIHPGAGFMEGLNPVITRNANMAWEEVRGVLKGTKRWDKAIKDFGKSTVVIWGQGEKVFLKVKHPYVSDLKRIRTLERTWRADNNMPVGTGGGEGSKKSPYYWDMKQALLLSKTDEEMAKAYYAAFDYICHDLEVNEGWPSKVGREREARRRLKLTLSHMNPLLLSSNKKGAEMSNKNKFLKFLSPANRKMALDLEKTYHVRLRRFNRVISNPTYINKYSIYPG